LVQASDAGSFEVSISLDQTLRQEHPLRFGAPDETAHFEIEGSVAKPDRARFSILPGRTSFALAKTDAQEFLTVDSKVYRRVGERWVESETNVPATEVDGLGLSLLSVARDVTQLEPAAGPPALRELAPTFRRVSFNLYPDDVRDYLLRQQGVYDPLQVQLARLGAPIVEGSGELWIDDAGFPARLVLNLEWVERGQDPYRVMASITTDYGAFGQQFSDGYFDPLASTQTGAHLPLSMAEQWPRFGMWISAALGVLFAAWLLFYASRRWRWVAVSITITLILTLLTPSIAPVAEAAGIVAQPKAGQTESTPAAGSEVAKMLDETRQLITRHTSSNSGPAGALADEEDLDGDGLPNGYELRLGTSPYSTDSDYDGLSDYVEVTGYECEWVNHLGQPQTDYIVTNPLNPDSNDDGLPDGQEVWRGECADDNAYGYFWDDDNDDDGVPDGIDLSPFSMSHPQSYGGSKVGPNLVFETLDQDAGPGTTLYPFYVELQVRPVDAESLRWAYKNLYWPEDHLGAIQSNGAMGTFIAGLFGEESGAGGKMELVPFLQAIVTTNDLPSQEAMDHYGVSVSELEDEEGNWEIDPSTMMPLYEMTMPLVPIERGGQVYAFQAKMLHDQNTNTDFTRHWHDVRLKWAVVGDVLMANSEGEMVPNPHGGYGLIVYDEPYILTGLQVSRQGGASILLAAALPSQGEPYDDGPISLLRAGMEARFLPGALSMAEIKERFDHPLADPGIDPELRWGIPQDREYRVMYDPATMTYEHLDEAIATTTMTTTAQMLDQNFAGYENLQPSVILASDQRTSTINLDDDPPADYAEFTINTCLKPMMSSRSLKLQTYRWEMEGLEGAWTPLTLDEVLQKIELDYAATTDPNYEFYFEELNILKLAATTWQIGQTALYKIANVVVHDHEAIMTDPEVLFKLLDANGLLPEYFMDAVEALMDVWEAGGPLKWFETQWNKVTSAIDKFGETIKGSFLDFSSSNSPPSDAVSGAGEGGGGEQEPPISAAEFEEEFLSWTDTAITVLTTLASITGLEFFSQVAKVLTRMVQVYKALRKLVDSVKAIADLLKSSAKPLQAAADMLVKELGGMSQQMSVLGLIVGIWAIWAGLMMTLAAGDLGPVATVSLVLKAIIQTAMLVALFVLATLFPWGTLIAGIIGLVTMLSDLIGVPLDPISALVELLTPEQEDLTGYVDAQFDALAIEPLDPGGAMIVREPFRVQVEGNIYMGTYPEGTVADLMLSHAQLYVYPDTTYPALDWGWGRTDWADPAIGYTPYQVSDGEYHRRFYQRAGVDLTPWHPKINSVVLLYAQTEMTIRYQECTLGGLICSAYPFTGWSDRSYLPLLYFDLLPHKLTDLWHWDELLNRDPDGDGLIGYVAPGNGELIGPDADLCPGSLIPSWNDWDTDNDGLSDKFELESEGFDPCEKDTDGDEVTDQRELFKGTRPDNSDTDGDGLTDREEDIYSNGVNLQWPWHVDMGGLYPGLPDPVAFPNPRHANLDGDYLGDSREKEMRTSPNSMNPPPLDEPLELWVTQECSPNQGTEITITSSPWANEELSATNVELELTLPVDFSSVTDSAGLRPLLPLLPEYNYSPISFHTAESYWWALPPIFYTGRYVHATLSGVPDLPTEPVSVTARLEYDEGTVTQVSTRTVPLRVNVGGPTTRLVDVLGATVLGRGTGPLQTAGTTSFDRTSVTQANGSVLIAADAGDPEWVKGLFMCVKTSDTCSGSDWQPATVVPHTPFWLYEFTPPADDTYYVRAYAVDTCGTSGPPSNAWTLGIDQTRPAGVRFDQDDAVYLTSAAINEQPTISFSGWATDTAHAPYVSGVDWVGILADLNPLGTTSVEQPGEISSSFVYSWTLPEGHNGSSMRGFTPAHDLLVGIADVAGNIGMVSDTLHIVVDDTPPLAYARPQQTLAGETLTLSGLADDTALLYDRGPAQPYAAAQTAADYDAAFDSGADMGSAVIAGDINGDQIDDVVLLIPPILGGTGGPGDTAFSAGLFLGRPEGLSSVLNIADADVLLNGALPLPVAIDYPPTAAALGDVNGDGLDDLLLGDPSTNTGAGKAYVVLGRRDWPATLDLSTADWVLSAAGSNAFGNAVGAAGDVNGDGLADFLVGATGDGVGRGVVWLYLGREQEAALPHTTFYPPGFATSPPAHLAGLGDTNGDGLSDFLIAFAGPIEAPTPVALVHGRPDDAWPVSPVDLGSEAAALFLGRGTQQTVSAAGDLDGDGLRDLLIGDPDATEPRVYILLGRRPEDAWRPAPDRHYLSDVADASFVDTGTAASRLGASLTTLGDVDGDHRDDFAFGQPGSGTTLTRVAIVLSEKRTLTPDMPIEMATHLITGAVPGYYFGSLLSAGDANGDHVPDLLAGAAGEYRTYLFYGGFETGSVSGVAQVELGFFGPVTDPTQPYTATMPAAWQTATLTHPNEPISAWRGELNVPAEGDYRLYARPQDQVGNMPETETWYLGNVWANSALEPLTGADITMDTPVLLEQTNLTLSGTIESTVPIQHLRVYNGYEWQRLQPEIGGWSWDSVLPHHDERLLTFRAVARDAFGVTLHATSTLQVDTSVGQFPNPAGNLPLNLWHTDISPTLVISWPVVSDANGIARTWATIDTSGQTSPVTPVSTNEVTRVLDAPGIYYGHVRLQDGVGNEATGHTGPYLVNRTHTPSLILPDGRLSASAGEYPASTLLSNDPYSTDKPASLWGTWDADSMYLGYPSNGWGPDKSLSIYLDTTLGGVTRTMALMGDTHTLPFEADYAFVVGEGDTLYSAASGDWVPQSSPLSYAITQLDTELVLDRSEIQATGAISTLVYIEDDQGVRVILPPEARLNGNRVIVGPTTFVGNLYWPDLADGVLPHEGQGQVISPTVTIERNWDNVVNSGQATTMWVHVGNPDPKAYDMETLVVEADREMVWTGVSGATCIDCPADSGLWTLGVDVEAGGTQTVTLEALALGDTAVGVVPISVTATLPGSGLPLMEKSSARARLDLDRSTAEIAFTKTEVTMYARPGATKIPFLPGMETAFERCSQQIEENVDGQGWSVLCDVGDCLELETNLSDLFSQQVQLRVVSDNGCSSDPISKIVAPDSVSPTVQIVPTVALSGTLAFVRGTAWDEYPTSRTPERVEVSIDGGRYHAAFLSAVPPEVQYDSLTEPISMTTWLFPLHLTSQDGLTVTLSARAVDEAGNVGPASDPVTITLDNIGPTITVSQTESLLEGTIHDGSGVDSFGISLDGGTHYEPVALAGENWTFELSAWPGALPQSFAMLHAVDVWGNDSYLAFPIDFELERVYLPLVVRSSPSSDPTPTTLDSVGPLVTVTQTGSLLEGTVTDDSGVDSFEISLDGGTHYEPVALAGENWTFELSAWPGALPQSFAMLHAVDAWGNDSHVEFPIVLDLERVFQYLPLIMRSESDR
jgi:hypothetical protein